MMEILITALGQHGDGVGEVAGAKVFVPFTLPGERVEAVLEGERGALLEVLAPSPERIEPFCPHFGSCGGCTLIFYYMPCSRSWRLARIGANLCTS